jgi:hypothetical protein
MIINGKKYQVLQHSVEGGVRWQDSDDTPLPWYKLLVDDKGDIFLANHLWNIVSQKMEWRILNPETCHIQWWAK